MQVPALLGMIILLAEKKMLQISQIDRKNH